MPSGGWFDWEMRDNRTLDQVLYVGRPHRDRTKVKAARRAARRQRR